jgi:hypothetical protein
MFGKTHHLNPLQTRKQLLIIESEVNRAQLVQECQAMADAIHSLARRAKTVSSLGVPIASLVTCFASLLCKKPDPAGKHVSWWKIILKGAGMISSLWIALSSPDCDSGQKVATRDKA